MKFEILPDSQAVANRAAEIIAFEARAAVAARHRFILALSGGRTPWAMVRALSTMDLWWASIDVFQVDERIAPVDDPDRNLAHLTSTLRIEEGSGPRIHAMPVETPDLADAVRRYEETLREIAGTPPVLDLVQLGLGDDGHTASLVPGDPTLQAEDAEVAVTGEYRGRRRMTLTYPILNRARRVLWVVTGDEKAEMLRRLLQGDSSIPAGRVRQDDAILLADVAAGRSI